MNESNTNIHWIDQYKPFEDGLYLVIAVPVLNGLIRWNEPFIEIARYDISYGWMLTNANKIPLRQADYVLAWAELPKPYKVSR